MKKRIGVLFGLVFALPLYGYTEFRWEWQNPKFTAPPAPEVDPEVEAIVNPFGSNGPALAPQSPVSANDDTFFIYASAYPNAGDPPDGDNNCSVPPNTVNSACYSLTKWLVRTIDALFRHYPFQLKVQQVVDNLLNSTSTAWPDPLFDMSLSLPLIGNYNIGMYIQDLWNPASCSPSTLNPFSGPRLLANPNQTIGCKFQDDDTRAIDLIGEVFQAAGGYSINVIAAGTTAGDGTKLPTGASGTDHDGGIEVQVTIPQLDADIIFRQPDFPKYITDGYYLHAAGKLRLYNLQLQLRVFSISGFLRSFFTTPGPGNSGYSIGVDLERVYIAGGIALDVDGFNCGEWNNPSTASTMDPTRVYNNTPSCDVDDMSASHPDKSAGQNQYTNNTNTRNQIIAEVVKYIEANLVYEATRTSNSTILQYLTALEALDLRTVTHTKQGNFFLPPTIAHPFDSNRYIYLDYGLFWRFNADQQAGQEGVDMPGGIGLSLTASVVPSECLTGNPIPGSRNTWQITPPQLYHTRVRNSQLAFVGAGLHRNLVNTLVDQVWAQQIPCMSLWKGTPGMGSSFSSILTGSTFKMFLPGLRDTYANRDMMVRVVPRYVKPGDTAAAYTANDQPRVIYNPGDPAWLIAGTGYPDPRYPGPFDLQVTAPHIELQFLVDSVGNGQYTSFSRILSIDAWLSLYAGIGWYRITSYPSTLPPTFIDPVGRCDLTPFPCRVLRLGVAFQPGINIVYDYATATYFDTPGLTRAIAGIIGLLFNGVLQGKLEIALNTASPSFLGVAVDPADPPAAGSATLGTLFVPLDLDGDSTYESLGFYLKMADLYGGFVTTTGDPIAGADGRADAISPKFIMDTLNNLGVWSFVGGAPSAQDLGGPTPVSLNYPADTHFSPDTLWDLPEINRTGSEIELTPEEVRRLGLGEDSVWLNAAGLTPYVSSRRMIFHYRVDGGVYQIGYGGKIRIPPLFDGQHTIEVQAVDPDRYLDPTPAVLRFTLDRFPPMIRFVGDLDRLGEKGRVELGLELSDAVTPRERIRLAYALDDASFKPLDPERPYISERVAKGEHILKIRAEDESGNLATRELRFYASASSGFGCSLAGSSSSWAGLLALLILISASFALLRRRGEAGDR